ACFSLRRWRCSRFRCQYPGSPEREEGPNGESSEPALRFPPVGSVPRGSPAKSGRRKKLFPECIAAVFRPEAVPACPAVPLAAARKAPPFGRPSTDSAGGRSGVPAQSRSVLPPRGVRIVLPAPGTWPGRILLCPRFRSVTFVWAVVLRYVLKNNYFCKVEEHIRYMRRCLQLAANGMGQVSPNPLVGAVIVHRGRIIGEGWHRHYGGPHAEVNAVNEVLERYPDGKDMLQEATLYVNLEPCVHQGKTPPCTELIIRHGIQEVVIGCTDPHEKVAGKGIERLAAAGIRVHRGVLEEACLELNRRFVLFQTQKRPYVILKWAQTRNGYFAPLDASRFWITSPLARQLVHRWRSEEDAVLVGYRTALADDPELTVRE